MEQGLWSSMQERVFRPPKQLSDSFEYPASAQRFMLQVTRLN